MGCLKLDILDEQFYGRTALRDITLSGLDTTNVFLHRRALPYANDDKAFSLTIGAASTNMSERERTNTLLLKMSERSGDHIFSKHFSFASFSFVATKENEEGSINMNGRLYDQLLGRMLSPDPFVQAPTFTQSFNRYSYVWNNPLRYIDPSGYLTWCHISRSFCPGYQSQFFSMMEMQQALLATDGGGGGFSFWTGQGFIGGVPGAPRLGTPGGVVAFQAANRIPAIGTPDMIINGQRFYHTPLGDRAVSSYFFGRMSGTMDTEVTLRGVAVVFPNARDPRGGYNIFARGHLPGGGGKPKKTPAIGVSFNRGIPQFETNFTDSRWGAITPGPFIIYQKGGASDPYFNRHEPGHVIQFLILGPLYYPLVALPSLITAPFDFHNNMPWEKSANQLWYWFTGEYDPRNPLYTKRRLWR